MVSNMPTEPPKLLIVSEQGKFLLKRRARGRDDPFKVAFTHAIQLHLAAKQFPLPHLIGTRKENNSMLQWRNGVYELFEYIPGTGYPQTLESTFDSGRVLALYHKLLENFKSEWKPPTGSYHQAQQVEQAQPYLEAAHAKDVTHGRISLEGVFPLVPSLDTVGALAASLDDLELATKAREQVRIEPQVDVRSGRATGHRPTVGPQREVGHHQGRPAER